MDVTLMCPKQKHGIVKLKGNNQRIWIPRYQRFFAFTHSWAFDQDQTI